MNIYVKGIIMKQNNKIQKTKTSAIALAVTPGRKEF
jgi:hypothetical protein